MKLQASSQEVWRRSVILNPPPQNQKHDYRRPMRISRQDCHPQNQQSRNQGTDEGNEFEKTGNRSECERVWKLDQQEKRSVCDERQRSKQQLCTNECGQHRIKVVQHYFQEPAMRTAFDKSQECS